MKVKKEKGQAQIEKGQKILDRKISNRNRMDSSRQNQKGYESQKRKGTNPNRKGIENSGQKSPNRKGMDNSRQKMDRIVQIEMG